MMEAMSGEGVDNDARLGAMRWVVVTGRRARLGDQKKWRNLQAWDSADKCLWAGRVFRRRDLSCDRAGMDR